MKSKMSRAAVAVSVVAALGFTAACGGGGDENPKKDSNATAPVAEDRKDAAGQAALTEAQLKKAVLANGEVKGYEIADTPAEDMNMLDADKAEVPAEAQVAKVAKAAG